MGDVDFPDDASAPPTMQTRDAAAPPSYESIQHMSASMGDYVAVATPLKSRASKSSRPQYNAPSSTRKHHACMHAYGVEVRESESMEEGGVIRWGRLAAMDDDSNASRGMQL